MNRLPAAWLVEGGSLPGPAAILDHARALEIAAQRHANVAPLERQGSCEWRRDPDPDTDAWATECGELWVMAADTPRENGMNFCPCCGGHLKQIDA